ncbi:hypothetical protein [Burkholderia seminalis]|uniref:hypothetical protein n=1 Tax=Burkholderia seminalis TaxID=488731 RepID=UPI0012E3E33E|nr:hypothetical protein [Burkholderia seminalis]MCA8039412.1 hypothetical protein [Burkholderia seminalis]
MLSMKGMSGGERAGKEKGLSAAAKKPSTVMRRFDRLPRNAVPFENVTACCGFGERAWSRTVTDIRKGCESDWSDGQRNTARQQYAYRRDVVSSGIPNRDLSLTAAPFASGRFFSAVHAGVNALWRSVGAAAIRFISAGSTE